MFENKYERQGKRYSSALGDRFAPVYTLSASEKGVIELDITSEKDLYAEIQSHADSVDIKSILLRYEKGETDVLDRKKGSYIDITEMPTNFAGLISFIQTAKNNFLELPLEVRREYNHSAEEYIADIGSQKWLSLMANKSEPNLESKSEPKSEPKPDKGGTE